jgi:hypothetical protein
VAVEDCEEAEGGLPVHADLNDVGVLRARKGDGRWGGGKGCVRGGGEGSRGGLPRVRRAARCAVVGAALPLRDWRAIIPPRRRSRAGPRERPLHAAGATGSPRVFPFPAPPNAVRDGRGPSAANATAPRVPPP